MNEPYHPKARSEEILAQDVADEVVIYDLKDNKAFCLNPAAADIWKHCDGQTPIAVLSETLNKHGVSAEPAAVSYILDELDKAKLLDAGNPTSSGSPEVTRRELIGKLGVGAALVLSCVTMMSVPTVAQALSIGPTGPTGP